MSGLRPSLSTVGLATAPSSTRLVATSTPTTTTLTPHQSHSGLPSHSNLAHHAHQSHSNLSQLLTTAPHAAPTPSTGQGLAHSRSYYNTLSRAQSHVSLVSPPAAPTAPTPTATVPAPTPSPSLSVPLSAPVQPIQTLATITPILPIHQLPRSYISNHNGLVIGVYARTPISAQKSILEYIDLFIYNVLSYANQWYYIISALSLDYTCVMANLLACDFFVATEDLPSALQCLKRCGTLLGPDFTTPPVYSVSLGPQSQTQGPVVPGSPNVSHYCAITVHDTSASPISNDDITTTTPNTSRANIAGNVYSITTNTIMPPSQCCEVLSHPTTITRREALYYRAYSSWLSGDMNTSLSYWLTIVSYYPQDIFAMKRAQLLAFLLGKKSIMVNVQLIPSVLQHNMYNVKEVYVELIKLLINFNNNSNPSKAHLSSHSDSTDDFWSVVLNSIMKQEFASKTSFFSKFEENSNLIPYDYHKIKYSLFQPSKINFYQTFSKLSYFFGMLAFALEQTGSYTHALQSGYLGTLLALLQRLLYTELNYGEKNDGSNISVVDIMNKPTESVYSPHFSSVYSPQNTTKSSRKAHLSLYDDPWSHHGMFHALFGLNQHGLAINLGLSLSPAWDNCMSFMFTHNWFHITLMFLELGSFVSALNILDIVLWAFTTDKTKNITKSEKDRRQNTSFYDISNHSVNHGTGLTEFTNQNHHAAIAATQYPFIDNNEAYNFYYVGNGHISTGNQLIVIDSSKFRANSAKNNGEMIEDHQDGFYFLANDTNTAVSAQQQTRQQHQQQNNHIKSGNSSTQTHHDGHFHDLFGYYYKNLDIYNLYRYHYYLKEWDVYEALHILGYRHVDEDDRNFKQKLENSMNNFPISIDRDISTSSQINFSNTTVNPNDPVLYVYNEETLDSVMQQNKNKIVLAPPESSYNLMNLNENLNAMHNADIPQQEHEHIHHMTIPVTWKQFDVNYPLALQYQFESLHQQHANTTSNQKKQLLYDMDHYNGIKNAMPRVNKSNTQDQCGAIGLMMKLELHAIIYSGILCHNVGVDDMIDITRQQNQLSSQYHCKSCTYHKNTTFSNVDIINDTITPIPSPFPSIHPPQSDTPQSTLSVPCSNPALLYPYIPALNFRYETILSCINLNNPHQDPFYDILSIFLLLRCNRFTDAQYYIDNTITTVDALQATSPARYTELNAHFVPFVKALYYYSLCDYPQAAEYLFPIFMSPVTDSHGLILKQPQSHQQREQLKPTINAKAPTTKRRTAVKLTRTTARMGKINSNPTSKQLQQYMLNHTGNNQTANSPQFSQPQQTTPSISQVPTTSPTNPQSNVNIVKLLSVFNLNLTQTISSSLFSKFKPFITIFTKYIKYYTTTIKTTPPHYAPNKTMTLSPLHQLYQVHQFLSQTQSPAAQTSVPSTSKYTLNLTNINCFGASNEQLDVLVDFFTIVLYLSPAHHTLLLDVINMRLAGRDSMWLRQMKANVNMNAMLNEKVKIAIENHKQLHLILHNASNDVKTDDDDDDDIEAHEANKITQVGAKL